MFFFSVSQVIVSAHHKSLTRAVWKMWKLMKSVSKNRNLQVVCIKLYISFFLCYIILTYIVTSSLCLYGVIQCLAFVSASLGSAPPPLATYEYPSLPITKSRQEVQCIIHTLHTHPTTQPDGLKVHFHCHEVLFLLVMLEFYGNHHYVLRTVLHLSFYHLFKMRWMLFYVEEQEPT